LLFLLDIRNSYDIVSSTIGEESWAMTHAFMGNLSQGQYS